MFATLTGKGIGIFPQGRLQGGRQEIGRHETSRNVRWGMIATRLGINVRHTKPTHDTVGTILMELVNGTSGESSSRSSSSTGGAAGAITAAVGNRVHEVGRNDGLYIGWTGG